MARRASCRIANRPRIDYRSFNRFGPLSDSISESSDERGVVPEDFEIPANVEVLEELLEETNLDLAAEELVLQEEPPSPPHSSSSSSSGSSNRSTSDEDDEEEMVTGAPPVPPEVFETNPFSGNINPSNANGLKLYQAATSSRDEQPDLLSLKIANATQFIDAMKEDATKFGWV